MFNRKNEADNQLSTMKCEMTREQYEMQKSLIEADYIKEKQSIIDEFNSRLAVFEENFKKAGDVFREAKRRWYDTTTKTKEWYDREVENLKVWLINEEQKAAREVGEIMKIRLRYKDMRADLTQERNKRLNANDKLISDDKMVYNKAVERWLINVRELHATRELCRNRAVRCMVERLSNLPKPEVTEEGGAR